MVLGDKISTKVYGPFNQLSVKINRAIFEHMYDTILININNSINGNVLFGIYNKIHSDNEINTN